MPTSDRDNNEAEMFSSRSRRCNVIVQSFPNRLQEVSMYMQNYVCMHESSLETFEAVLIGVRQINIFSRRFS